MYDEISIKRTSNTSDILRLVLRRLNSLNEQFQFSFHIDKLPSDVPGSLLSLQSFERQVAAQSAELASARGDMTLLEKCFALAQRHLSDGQHALNTV